VFGGIDRDTRECFAVTVEKRDAPTLLPIIQQFILPGTTILSDQLAAYNNITSCPEGYEHKTVNHSLHFVDPVTHTHTQNIENMWMCIKRKKKQQMGQHRSLLSTHLGEFMWRRKFGDRPFENLVKCIRDLYPVA
jgi:transposase-like protein